MTAGVALVPALALALLAAPLLCSPWLWSLAGLGGMPPYADLMQLTYSADCPRPGGGVVGSRACDPFGRPFNYPPAWLVVSRALGLGAASTTAVGVTLIALAVAAIAYCTVELRHSLTWWRLGLLVVVVASPPMMLLVIRANTDLLILALLVAACVAAQRGWRYTSAGIVAVTAGLKLFPVGAVIGQRDRRAMLGAAAGAAVSMAILAGPWLAAIRATTPASTNITVGAGVLPAIMRGAEGVALADQVAGAALVASLAAAGWCSPAVRGRSRQLAAHIVGGGFAGTLAATGVGVYLSTSLLTTSFDYRLFPLVFVAAGLLALPAAGRPAVGVSALAAAVCWLSFPTGPLQWVGDVAATALAAGLLPVAAQIVLWRVAPRSRYTSPPRVTTT